MGRKNVIAKGRRRRRKAGPPLRDNKYWACGRKVLYATQREADEVALALGHTAYKCNYCFGYHTAHLPGSQRIIRRQVA